MLKKYKILLAILAVSLILIARHNYIEYIENKTMDKITYIEISQFRGSDSKTIDRAWKFEEKEHIKKFMKGMNDKVKIREMPGSRPRDYKILIGYNDGNTEEFSLWTGDYPNPREGNLLNQGNKWWRYDITLLFEEEL